MAIGRVAFHIIAWYQWYGATLVWRQLSLLSNGILHGLRYLLKQATGENDLLDRSPLRRLEVSSLPSGIVATGFCLKGTRPMAERVVEKLKSQADKEQAAELQKNDSNLNPSGIVGEVSVQEFDCPPFAYTLILYICIYIRLLCALWSRNLL